jgi:hypothetical protein
MFGLKTSPWRTPKLEVKGFHIFVLKCILEKYLKTDTKKLFVCFVDFHKAFDTVIHPGIRYKLIRNGINGLFYKIICNMYSVHQDRGQTT